MPLSPVTCLENIKEFVQIQGHGVKGLVDVGIKSLPNQYILPEDERFNKKKIILTKDGEDHLIPTINMSNLDDEAMETLICNAAEKWGFFQIVNHGVPLKMLEDVKAATHRFFELPVEEKVKYLEKNSPTKNVKYGTSFVPHFEKVLEWKDYLSLFFISDEEALTHWPPACRDEALDYFKSIQIVIKNLCKILMKGLNIHEIDERLESLLMGLTRMNLTFYPKCPNPELTFGAGPHSDASIVTILLQDDIGGLYVRHPDDISWVYVPPVNGALVINVGDVLQILSNGKYKSVEHLVIPNGSKTRVSIPIFVHPTLDMIIGPLQETINRGEKPLYKDVLFLDYIRYFFSKPHDGKATVEFAKL